MKFFVSTILESDNDYVIAGDVLYLEDQVVQIAGVKHSLFYGDVIVHGVNEYKVNEEHISDSEFDNSFDHFWYLTNGLIPQNNERYFIIEDQEINLDSDMAFMREYMGKIISRNELGVYNVQAMDGTKIYHETTKTPFDIFLNDLSDISKNNFATRLEEYNAGKLQEIIENEQLIETIASNIPIPKDGVDGKDGEKGQEGIQGPIGETGIQGIPGTDGPMGKQGPAGPEGIQGLLGEMGPQGETGKQGADGKDGAIGDIGPRGFKGDTGEQGLIGEQGPIGPIGETGPIGLPGQDLLTEERDKKYEALRKELDKFKELDTKYKTRLNTQLGTLGGGGSTRILDMDDVVFNKPLNLSNHDFLVFDSTQNKFIANNIVTIIAEVRAELEMQYDKLVDEQVSGSDTLTYIGEAAPGGVSSVAEWRIKRLTEYANGYMEIIWADNTETLDKVWNDRETYTYDV